MVRKQFPGAIRRMVKRYESIGEGEAIGLDAIKDAIKLLIFHDWPFALLRAAQHICRSSSVGILP